MYALIKGISDRINNLGTYLIAKERQHSDAMVGAIALGSLSSTAILGGIAAFNHRSLSAVGITLAGVTGTALYGLQQLYLSRFNAPEQELNRENNQLILIFNIYNLYLF